MHFPVGHQFNSYQLFYLYIFHFVLLKFVSYLRWQETGRHEGISIAWQDITLHAISNNPVKCIYLMMDQRCDYPPEALAANGNGNGRATIEEDDEGTCEGESGWARHTRI